MRMRDDDRRERDLLDKLYRARRALVGTLPSTTERLLLDYYSCKDRSEANKWLEHVVEELIGTAVPIEGSGRWGPERAICPLCKGSSNSPFDEGFALPEGLRRHLSGWGNARQCVMTEAAFQMAWDHWNDKFREAEEAEARTESARHRQRMETEDLYLVDPRSGPQLFENGIFFRAPRKPEQMKWAVDRLRGLGFNCLLQDRVWSFTFEAGGIIVFADPRESGRIDFKVFKSPLPKKWRNTWGARERLQTFHVLDSWKNGIAEKFKKRLDQAIEGLLK